MIKQVVYLQPKYRNKNIGKKKKKKALTQKNVYQTSIKKSRNQAQPTL